MFDVASPASFETVLSSLQRAEEIEPRVRVRPAPFDAGDDAPHGFAKLADQAFEEFAGDVRPAEPLPGDSVEAVAAELALASIKDRAGLRALRRRFMFANHPDRRPDWPRDLANRRVAIANMLIDAALNSGAR